MGVDPECQSARVPEPEQLAPLLCPFLVSITLLTTHHLSPSGPLAGPPRLRPLRSRPGKLSPFPAQSCPVLPNPASSPTRGHAPPHHHPKSGNLSTPSNNPYFGGSPYFRNKLSFSNFLYMQNITFFEKAIIHSYKLQIYIYIRS